MSLRKSIASHTCKTYVLLQNKSWQDCKYELGIYYLKAITNNNELSVTNELISNKNIYKKTVQQELFKTQTILTKHERSR